MSGLSKALSVAIGVAFVSSVMLVEGQQPSTAGPFTADQAQAGRAAFQANCAGCHGADLQGYPPLAGSAFMGGWGTRTTRDLLGLIQTTMPTDRPGALPVDTYINIVAFILQSNGRTAGTQALTATTSVAIGGGAQTAAAAPAQNANAAPAGRGAGAQGGAAGGRGRGEPAAPVTGLTVTGEVKDFTRMTDEMLRNPAPGDWLTIRRDHFADNYSPLTQITRDNASELQLAWVAPMAEGGTNQPSPLAHNGTIFLNNTNGIIQALNGKTGDLIWEHRLGGNIAMRGISLYDDKLFIAMSDANLVALDAKTGKQVWKAAMPDGRGSSSGPMVAKGKVIEGMGGCQQYIETKCFISAYDAQTGKQLWRFYTVATEGEAG